MAAIATTTRTRKVLYLLANDISPSTVTHTTNKTRIFQRRQSTGVQRVATLKQGFWIERWTGKEQREEFYRLASESFFNSSISRRYLPDGRKRKEFLPAYLRYLYDHRIIDNKAWLGAVKKSETKNGVNIEKTIFLGLCQYDMAPDPKADPSEMLSIYKEGAVLMMTRDQWAQQNIHSPLSKIAEDLGTEAWSLARVDTISGFKGPGQAVAFHPKLARCAYDYGFKYRGSRAGEYHNIPPFYYVEPIDVFPAVKRSLKSMGLEAIDYFHFNYRPGLRCYLEPGVKGGEYDVACYLVAVEKRVAAIVKEKMETCRSSV